jgi:hypothetical protein
MGIDPARVPGIGYHCCATRPPTRIAVLILPPLAPGKVLLSHRCVLWSFLLALLLIPVALRAQDNAEIVRGRITDGEQKPVADAIVTVTATSSQLIRTTHTDRDGRFNTLFLEGDGSYSVMVRKIGFTPAIKRAARGPLSNVAIVDVVLSANAYPLEPLTVTALRPAAAAKLDKPSIGGIEQNMLSATAFLTDPNNLDALIALTPGVMGKGDSGYSVMGASTDQNSKMLDGMKFDGASLPPDAVCSAGVATSTSDPSRGGFAGGQTSIQTCRGRDYFVSTVRASLIDPATTWSDAASPISPSRIGNWSGLLSGALRTGVAHYNLSFSGNLRATDAPSLLAPRTELLPQLGLSGDTVAAVRSALGSLRVPLTASAIPSDAQRRNANAVLTIDWNPGAETSLLMTAVGSLAGTDAAGLSQTGFPSSLNQTTQRLGRVQVRASTYLHGFVDDLTTAFTASSNQSSPYLALPSGNVLVGTEFADGQTSLTALRFGGGSSESNATQSEWNTTHQVSWLSQNGMHQLSFGQQVIFDWASALQAYNTLGAFNYQTLADLIANRPASFTRTLDATERSNQSASGAIWVRDIWRASKVISVEGGFRVDAAHFGTTPDYNPAIDSLFGRRTDHVPADFGISPRLGFAWFIKQRPDRTSIDPRTGQSRSVGFQDGDFTSPGYLTAPRGNSTGAGITLIGNIGAYRGVIPPSRVAALVDRTGLPETTRTLSCIGDAAPIPDWSTSTGALFSSCADGATPVYASNLPTVSLIDPSMRAPVDWKLNVGLTGLYAGSWSGNTSLILLREENTESWIDLNLRRTAGFALPEETGRPVYVLPEEIVPQTGLIAPNANRISSQYGTVTNTLSDLHRTAAQFNINVNTPVILRKISFRLDYSYNAQRNEYRGFGGSTAGDPSAIESAAGAQPLHQLTVSTARSLRIWWFTSNVRAVFSSGVGYTPMVVGDINGDGMANDRAFIANPAATADTALASQMRMLLAAAPATARNCLQAQIGQIAATNSCRGPGQIRLDLNLDFSPPQGVGLGDRLHITTRFFNAGAAVMRLLGVNSAVSQGSASPDGRLLYVTRFDPAAQRYSYRVNQAFGQPLDFGLGNHRFPPFQLQIGVEYKLGVAPPNPNLRRWGLLPSRTDPLTTERVRQAFQMFATNPVDTLLALRDSLGMSPDQVTMMRAIRNEYQQRLDSVVTPAVTYVVQRGMKLTDNDLNLQILRLSAALDTRRTNVRDRSLAVLTKDQQAKWQAMIEAAYLAVLRRYHLPIP